MEYDNTNRGAIFSNTDKPTDKHPDYSMNLNIDGVDYVISGWKRKPDAHPKAPVISLSIQKKDAQQTTTPLATDFDSEIPF